MNNKGFAVSTLVYGLSIMGIMIIALIMAMMSTTRSNTSDLSKTIEDELNGYSSTSVSFDAKDTVQPYRVPEGEGGWYRVELWGASGSSENGGAGAYTAGIIKLDEQDEIYFYVGSSKKNKGGEESSVRIESGSVNDSVSINSRIMVAGGGSTNGGVGGTFAGYLCNTKISDGRVDYTKNAYSLASGNLIGMTKSDSKSYSDIYNTYLNLNTDPIAYNTSNNADGAGKGYYNGKDANQGGSSFIAGYAGSVGYNRATNSSYQGKYHHYYCEYNNDRSCNYKDTGETYIFYDGIMIPGAHIGDGKARISLVLPFTVVDEGVTTTNNELPIQNKKMSLPITQIGDCVEGYTGTTKIYAIDKDGVVYSTSGNGSCVTLNLGSAKQIVDITTIHSNNIGVDNKNHKLSISDGSVGYVLKDSGTGTSLSTTETLNGYHFSAYQPDYSDQTIATGNYYIFSVLSENKVLSASNNDLNASEPLSFKSLDGSTTQIWNIKEIDCKLYGTDTLKEKCNSNTLEASNKEYFIQDTTRNFVIIVEDSENKVNNKLKAENPANQLTRNALQIWKIKAIKNGTYMISSSEPKYDGAKVPGGLMLQSSNQILSSNGNYSSIKTGDNNKIIIGPNGSNDIERFWFYKLDF